MKNNIYCHDIVDQQSRYVAAPFRAWPIGFGIELVRLLADGRELVLPVMTKSMMESCRTPRSLAEQARHICVHNGERLADYDAITTDLMDMVVKGLLIAEKEFIGLIKPRSTRKKKISSMGVVSAHRPQRCAETLRTYLLNAALHSHQLDVVILDGSHELYMRKRYLEELTKVQAEHPAQVIRYAGRREKETFVSELIRLGVAPDVTRFALLGTREPRVTTVGANRNCLLLDLINEPLISADDDVTANAKRHPHYTPAVALWGHSSPRDIRFFEDRAQALDWGEWVSADVVGEHEVLLGRYVGDVVLDSAMTTVEGWNACDHMLLGVISGRARIPVTMAGVLGDFGGTQCTWSLLPDNEIRGQFLKSKATYDLSKRSREVLAVSPGLRITHSAQCMAMNIGLDNDGSLAPFLPIGRGEDGVFGSLMYKMDPGYCCGHIPIALCHETPPGRSYDSCSRIQLHELVKMLIASSSTPISSSGVAVLDLIGAYFTTLAELDDSDFAQVVSEIVLTSQANSLKACYGSFRSFPACPEYWKLDVERWHEKKARATAEPNSFIPVELWNPNSMEASLHNTKELLRCIGCVFSTWTDLMNAAKELKRRGTRIGLPLS